MRAMTLSSRTEGGEGAYEEPRFCMMDPTHRIPPTVYEGAAPGSYYDVIEPAQAIYDEADTDRPIFVNEADPARPIFVNEAAYAPVHETDTDQPLYDLADTERAPIEPVQYNTKFTADTGDVYTLPRTQRAQRAADLRESTHTMNCITDAAVYEYDFGGVYESVK